MIEDADWQNAYKEFVKPWSDRQLHWIPLWERDNLTTPEGAATVYLDAGMAFGTGAHETTRLCARRLQDYRDAHADQLDSLELIDAGCGSGVLALSASALGFQKILGFDFDPEAIVVCHSNSQENPHIAKLDFEVADLEKGLTGRQADLLLANIQTDVLIPHSRSRRIRRQIRRHAGAQRHSGQRARPSARSLRSPLRRASARRHDHLRFAPGRGMGRFTVRTFVSKPQSDPLMVHGSRLHLSPYST